MFNLLMRPKTPRNGWRINKVHIRRRQLRAELLEDRRVLALIPYGAEPISTNEYMLGDVYVSAVLLQGNGAIDPVVATWTPEMIHSEKNKITQGLQWWEDLLDSKNTGHYLDFNIDFTFTDDPFLTSYEPGSRGANEMHLWAQEFLTSQGFNANQNWIANLQDFNHSQRVINQTHWAFTYFIVNVTGNEGWNDGRGFASLNGYGVQSNLRAASTVAHEVGHVFFALDEYIGSRSYFDRRGYYNTQNLNATDNHPDPDSRVLSIMDRSTAGFNNNAVSPSAMAMIGWQDSDENGIFDVLDVPLVLEGVGGFDTQTNTFQFSGESWVQTLPNLNPSGHGNDITINTVSRVQYRLDGGDWIEIASPGEYRTQFDVAIGPLPTINHDIEIRTIADESGVTSNYFVGNTRFPTGVAGPGISGFAWFDANDNAQWDAHETGLEDIKIVVRDLDGEVAFRTFVMEPDDFKNRQLVNEVHPDVNLTAIGSDLDGRVHAFNAGGSTGDRVFAHRFLNNSWNTTWNLNRHLRADFKQPIQRVSIDVISPFNGAEAVMQAFSADNQLLGLVNSGRLNSGEMETLSFSLSSAEIDHVVIVGVAGRSSFRLDNLAFSVDAISFTDQFGFYSIENLEPATYLVSAEHPFAALPVSPLSGQHQIELAADQRRTEMHFGFDRETGLVRSNRPPEFNLPSDLTRSEVSQSSSVFENAISQIAPSPLRFLEYELEQSIRFTITPVSSPPGLLAGAPVITPNRLSEPWPSHASLTFFTTPHAFGTAVYEIVATDDHLLDPRSTTQLLTVTIEPVNDPPVAFDRLLFVDEAVEADGEAATVAFTAADLIVGRTGEPPSRAADVPVSVQPQFNESEQTLKVVAFAIPGQTNVDVADLPGGAGTVTRVLRSGGTVRFVFSGGSFVSGTYAPPIDFNLNLLFGGLDAFSYIVEDDGKTTISGPGGGVVFLPPERSNPASVTLRVVPANDPPVIPQFASMPIRLNESKAIGDQIVHLFGGSGNRILPGPATALDELAEQMVNVQLVAISVPGGNTPGPNSLMAAVPTIDVDGRVTWSINPHAFGVAVYDLVATDDHPSDPRSTTRRLTVAVDPTNDPPVAFPRTLEIHEAVEADDEVATLVFTADDLLSGRTGETTARAAELPANVPLLFDESEQTLKVVAFRIDGQPPVDVNSLAGGAGTVTRTLASGGVIELVFASGAFVSGNYRPPAHFNEGALFGGLDTFSYIVEDDGKTTIPGPGGGVVYLPPERSHPASVTLRVLPANDPPLIPEFSNLPVRIDETKTSGIQVVQLFGDSGAKILPGPITALDELAEQTVSVQLIAVAVPGGNTPGPDSLMAAAPTIDADGQLTLSLNPHAFGVAVYDLNATDDHPSDPRSSTKRLTITVEPVNDPPVVFERTFEVQEAVEADSEVATLVLTAADLLTGRAGETAARASDLPVGVPAIFDESEQSLKVVAFEIPGQPSIDVADLPGGTGTATRTLASGGVIEFVFADGAFVSGTYMPPTDFNLNSLFGGLDTFSYVVKDDGKTTIPGPGGGVVYLPPERSHPASVTLWVLPANDPPLIPEFSNLPVRLDETKTSERQFVQLFGDSGAKILPGPITALDELAEQTVTVQLIAVAVPGGNTPGPDSLMAAAPTVDADGQLTLSLNPHAFGVAVYDLIATDDHPSDPRSSTKRLTISVEPANDPPVGFERIFEVQEAVEADGEVATLVFTAENLLSGRAGDDPARAANFTASVPPLFDESEQTLKVVAFEVDGQLSVDVADLSGGTGTVSRALASGGLIEFVFADGAFASGTYTPPIDFNESPLFGGLDQFTYVVEDDGKSTIPGAASSPIFLPAARSQPAIVSLRVLATNDPPQFESLAEVVIAEVSTLEAIRVPGWATTIHPGPATAIDEWYTQEVIFSFVSELSTTPEGLFHSQPIVLSSGDLQLFPSPHANGMAILVIQATDVIKQRMEVPGGFVSRNTSATVTVTIESVNDAPQFNLGPDIIIGENRERFEQTWATEILPGPPEAIDELASQTVEFELAIDSNDFGLFAQGGLPTMDSQGVLRFVPHPTSRGQATIVVSAIDSAGGRSESVALSITLEDVHAAPVLNDLLAGTFWGRSVQIDLLQQIIASPVAINANSVTLETEPAHGSVTVLGDGRIRYNADAGFVGEDAFEVTVRDVDGRVSNRGVVTIRAVDSPAQNPLNPHDVNSDGDIHPLDALHVLVRLARAGREGVVGGLLASAVEDEVPQRYYDVDGNGRIEPLDALMVLTEIARRNRSGNSEGESSGSQPTVIRSTAIAPPFVFNNKNHTDWENDRASLSLPDGVSGGGDSKTASFDWDDDRWSVLASTVADGRQKQSDGADDGRELADAVWGQQVMSW